MSSTGIWCVCDIFSSEVVNQPGIDSSYLDFAACNALLDFWDHLSEPDKFKETEVRRNWQACQQFEVTVLFLKFIANVLGPSVTPNNCVVKWFSILIPANVSFSLVANAESFDFWYREIDVFIVFKPGKYILNGQVSIIKDLNRVMLKPAILRCDLSMWDDLFVNEFTIGGENGELGGGSWLIDWGDVLSGEAGLDESMDEGWCCFVGNGANHYSESFLLSFTNLFMSKLNEQMKDSNRER